MKPKRIVLIFAMIVITACAVKPQQSSSQNLNKLAEVEKSRLDPIVSECQKQKEQAKESFESVYEGCMEKNSPVVSFTNREQQIEVTGSARITFQNQEVRDACGKLKVEGIYQSRMLTKAKNGKFEKAECMNVFYYYPKAEWEIALSDTNNEVLVIPNYPYPGQQYKISCK